MCVGSLAEQVNSDGTLKKDLVTSNLAALETAATMDGGSKVVLMNFWPGQKNTME
jgi:hypothetical protein